MQLYTLPAIDYLRLRFHLKALTDCDLPAWKGSLLRGAFGHALRRTACTMKPGQLCESCMLRSHCSYTRIFETFIEEQPPPFLRGLDTSPRPFIFEPHDQTKFYNAGDTLWFDFILIGDVIDFVPYVVFAMMQMGHGGLGVKRHQFDLTAAYCFQPDEEHNDPKANPDWQLLYDGATQKILFTPTAQALTPGNHGATATGSVTLQFLTQTRLKFDNDLTMDFTFRMLVFKMLRRILELAYFYAPREQINWEFHPLLQAANAIAMNSRNLHWEEQGRYSSRQKAKMQLGGFVGNMTLQGDLAPFLDVLHYSEVLHVGKGTTFGLGRMEIE